VSLLTIDVLGPVALARDGAPVRLYRQEAAALAVLVAARGRPVSRETLISAIWPDGPESGQDGLATIMSRLRAKLAADGLRIPSAKGSGGYRLAGLHDDSLESRVDAFRFERARREGLELAAGGNAARALERFRAAAGEWRGTALDIGGKSWRYPRLCASFVADLNSQRIDLVTKVAQIALRLGRYQEAGFLRGHPVCAGHEAADVLWLLDVLEALRGEGAAAAERVIESRPPGAGYAQVVDRALDLVTLARSGVDVHRPLDAPPEPAAGGEPFPGGRAAELAALDAFGGRVAGGQPAVLAVRGPAGAGKTWLAEEFARSAAAAGLKMAVTSCQSHGELHPWRALAGTLWASALRDLSDATEPLSKAQQAALTDFVSGRPDRPSAAIARQRDLTDLTSALCALLRAGASDRGLVVVFDDADLLSPRGLELLGQVRTGLAGAPVGWLLIGRPDGNWTDIAELTRGEVLPPLTLSPPVPGDGGAPGPEQAGTQQAGTQQAARRWLAAAAITSAGLEIDASLVAEMLDLTGPQADRLRAAATTLGPLDAGEGLRFTAPAQRERLAEDLLAEPALARWLHRRAFDVLSARARAASWADPELPGRIAGHARQAGRALSEHDFARACLDAARAERAAGRIDAATGWAKTGLRRRCDLQTRFDLLLALGDAQNESGDMSGAGNQYLEAYEQAAGRPRWQAAAVIHLARRWSDPGQADDDLLHLLRSSLTALADADDAEGRHERLQIMAHLAHKSTMAVPEHGGAAGALAGPGPADVAGARAGPGPAGPDLARSALGGLTPDTPPGVACEVLNECRWGLYDHAAPAEALAISERLREASLRTRSAYYRSEALIALAIDQLRVGPVTRAEDTIAKHRRYVAQHPRPLGTWLQGTFDTLIDLWHGRFDAAEQRIFGESLVAVQQAQDSRVLPADTLQQTWQGQAYWLLRERGRMREVVDSAMAAGIEDHGYFPIWRAAWILACADTGRFAEASDRFSSLLADTGDLATLPPQGWAVPMLALLAESCAVLAAAGAGDAMPRFLVPRLESLLAGHADEIALAGWPTVLIGPVSRSRGLLALAAGDHGAAAAFFDRALPVIGDARPQVTRLRLDKARALLGGRQPDRPAATSLASQVRAAAAQLGMADLAGQADALLAQLAS